MTAKPPTGGALILSARPARRREPSATVWRLLAYDPATRTHVSDLAQRWQPIGTPSAGSAVPEPITAWLGTVLGAEAVIGAPADHYAGPDSWHITLRTDTRPDAPIPASPGGLRGSPGTD